ncbi:hypothetical protein FKO01_42775 [Mesorhizobium sp. B2-3-3]|nr:hypothetical protein FJ930_13480 [Mesorhizobium sp. B2-4-15]TPM24109.1 hypothetical protein FJ958_24230 [Mesorhizobium sp. B2-3-5]TPN09924.1 hypothetical protein FKO01_42775 [Mesorhizobium sp. B2-3-3]
MNAALRGQACDRRSDDQRAARSEVASFAVIVDVKDDGARAFYERESFLPFPDQSMKLFRPMADIVTLFR